MLNDTTNRRLDALGTLSHQGKRINGLYRLMENPVLWKQVYVNIYANTGATTAGVDSLSLDGMSYERLADLIAKLFPDTSYQEAAGRGETQTSLGESNGAVQA